MTTPFYILVATPIESSRLNKIFESGDDSIIDLLKNPGRLRRMGWDLETLNTPRIIEGEYLEVKNGDRKLINIYEDGTFILRVASDHTFLGWGRDETVFGEDSRLNPVALVELTYNFIDFYKKLIPHFTKRPVNIRFNVEFRNISKNFYLLPYGVGTYAWTFADERYHAPGDEMTNKTLNVKTDDILIKSAYVAYDLVKMLYLWFGIGPEKIPYISEDKNKDKFVDTTKIKDLKG